MENSTWNNVGILTVMEYAMQNTVGPLIVYEIQALLRPAGGGGIEGAVHTSVGNILMEQHCLGRLEKPNKLLILGLNVTTLLLFRKTI